MIEEHNDSTKDMQLRRQFIELQRDVYTTAIEKWSNIWYNLKLETELSLGDPALFSELVLHMKQRLKRIHEDDEKSYENLDTRTEYPKYSFKYLSNTFYASEKTFPNILERCG